MKEECLIAFVACAGMGAVGGLLKFFAIKVGFFVVLIMYSRMDFCFVSASFCSLLCASFATSKCRTHSCFYFKSINWREERSMFVVSCLVMYCTKVLMYRTMVLLARLTKVRR